MRILKNIVSRLHTYVLWALIAAVFWGFIFGIITDAPAEKKIVIFADALRCEEKDLDIELEKTKPDSIRLIRAHTFDYTMFDEAGLLNADIYLVPGSRAADYIESYSPLNPSRLPWKDAELWSWEGTAYGLKLQGALPYFDFGAEESDVYLFFGVNSVHTASLNGSADDAALQVAYDLSHLK
ncbi:MAG: hypothetical protein J6P48_00090 [Oscillospiraceae bacterium]|nr:hypothetical protein [Oscillospiraceae bacterium]